MDVTSALHSLKSISTPLLVDGGYHESGRILYVLTGEGVIVTDYRVYDPLLGPISFSLKHYAEIREIARECDSLEECEDLDPDEKLFLFNGGKPGVQYWAFQPHDEAVLEDYVFPLTKAWSSRRL